MLSYTHVICYIWPGKHCIIWLLQSYLHVELASTERNIPAKQFSGLTLASLQSDKFLKHHPGVKCAIRITNCGNMKKIPDSVSGGVVSKIDRGEILRSAITLCRQTAMLMSIWLNCIINTLPQDNFIIHTFVTTKFLPCWY